MPQKSTAKTNMKQAADKRDGCWL